MDNFFKALKEFHEIKNSEEKNKLREYLKSLLPGTGYIYLDNEDDFVVDEGIPVFEILAMGFTDFDKSEALMKKAIFEISDEAAKNIEMCFIPSATSSIKHEAIRALKLGLNENFKARVGFDYVFRKLSPESDGCILESQIIKITPPSFYQVKERHGIKKFRGEVDFQLPNGQVYFSCYSVNKYNYDKLMSKDYDSDKFLRCTKGVPEGFC